MGGTICTVRKPGQAGKALLPLPYFLVNKMLDSVISAEEKLGRPASIIEIFVEMKNLYTLPVNTIYEGAAVLTSLFREDLLYTNDTCSNYSVTRHRGFKNFTEMFNKWGAGYVFASDGTCISQTARTINFKSLWNMLKSKDNEIWEDNKWIYDGDFKFLDGQKLPTKIAFNTYPRSGNSFLRKYLEQITGVPTGATVQLHTSTSLQITGLKGEYIADDRVWIVKAHHPMLLPGVLKFESNKVICCVRNPLDVILSFASLGNTMSHSASPEFSYDKDYAEWWDWWVKDQAEAHRKYFTSMLKHCNDDRENPIYIMRYEDLVANPKQELEGIMKYLLDLDDLTGTGAEKRIAEVVKMGGEASQSYKLKPTTGKFNLNEKKYTQAQKDFIRDKNAEHLYYFGYTNNPDPAGPENQYASFNFQQHKTEHAAKYYGFRAQNQKWQDELVKSAGWKGKTYSVNNHKDCFDFYRQEEVHKVQYPSRNWAENKFIEAAAEKAKESSK